MLQKLCKTTRWNSSKSKFNIFNPYPGTSYQRPLETDMMRFKFLNQKVLICTIRSQGFRHKSACGQLKEMKQMAILEISF